MSHILWELYWTGNVDKFRRLLAPAAGFDGPVIGAKSPIVGSGSFGVSTTSPRAVAKTRKSSGYGTSVGGGKQGPGSFGKHEINSRDHAGLTILLRAASDTRTGNAIEFVRVLLEHPAVDIYVQDPESGWNALHRSLYAGNVSIARLLLEKERRDLTGHSVGTPVSRVGQLIKTKDHEGHSPFDLYNSTVAKIPVSLGKRTEHAHSDTTPALFGDWQLWQDPSYDVARSCEAGIPETPLSSRGDEILTFGSNKNLTLGLGDEDDRHYPERVFLKRPDHLLRRFYAEAMADNGDVPDHLVRRPSAETSAENEDSSFPTAPRLPNPDITIADIPVVLQSRPIIIQDVVLSKLHSAILTTDPVSNLYVCGIGRGGRLGLGDENTRFHFTPVQGNLANKQVLRVALGQNHTMVVTRDGELWTWGSNAFSQLGYAVPPRAKDEDPISTVPRQVFGSLKKETARGVAASAIHSVVHTGSSLFCWGQNLGQLGLMDADSRSRQVQQTPRKVAASLFPSPIAMVSAIDKATICLLEDHTVFVFTSYGYKFIKFPRESPFDHLLGHEFQLVNKSTTAGFESHRRTQIGSIASGGETIAAVSHRGDLFTMNLNQKIDTGHAASSTTNPSKIKDALTTPHCIWSAKQDGVRSVDVGEHGAVIISTQSGAVWRRVRRAKAKDSHVYASADSRRNDFKFQRVPYTSSVVSVRSSIFGAFAAVRKDALNIVTQPYHPRSIAKDIAPLFSLGAFKASGVADAYKGRGEAWRYELIGPGELETITPQVLQSADLERDLERYLTTWSFSNDALGTTVCTSTSPELKIPVHGWVLSARSSVLRAGLSQFRSRGFFELSDIFTISQEEGNTAITFAGLDLVTLLCLVQYMYLDKVIGVWHYTRNAPALAYRYRQIRLEVMKLSTALDMQALEAAARIQRAPEPAISRDFKLAMKDRRFFEDGDAVLELDGAEVTVHSAFLAQRCPWFQGLFQGRSQGMWLASRREGRDPTEKVGIDLSHMDSDAFRYAFEHMYTDTDPSIFSKAKAASLDDFLDLVMEVMGIADYLMLDQLSQICQREMGGYVNTRNIAQWLNAVGPYSVTEFKDAALDYVCVQMESMLENHLLDDLDDDLFSELEQVVQDRQMEKGQVDYEEMESRLLQENPELRDDIIEERQRRTREMAFKASQREDERKTSISFKSRFGSLDDFTPESLSPERTRRKSKAGRNEPFSPDLRPRASHAELMFDMDDEESSELSSSLITPSKTGEVRTASFHPGESSSPQPGPRGKTVTYPLGLPLSGSPAALPSRPALQSGSKSASDRTMPHSGSPWAPATLPTAKLDLREIMTEANSSKSALSAGLSAQKGKAAAQRMAPAKMSQKERKKQQQIGAGQVVVDTTASQSSSAWETKGSSSHSAPWKTPQTDQRHELKDALSEESKLSTPANAKPLIAVETVLSASRRTASPDTRFSGQSRMPSTPTLPRVPPVRTQSQPQAHSQPAVVPHSKNYIKPPAKADPPAGFLSSMADIIRQEQRSQQLVREQAAKRSLQEIQQEQAFQEWWDQEIRRTQEDEARRVAREAARGERGGGRGEKGEGSGRGRGRGRGGRGGGKGAKVGKGGGGAHGDRGGGGGSGGGDSGATGPAASGAKSS